MQSLKQCHEGVFDVNLGSTHGFLKEPFLLLLKKRLCRTSKKVCVHFLSGTFKTLFEVVDQQNIYNVKR